MRMLRLLPIAVLLLTGCFEGQKQNLMARNGKQVTEFIPVPPHEERLEPVVPPPPPPPPPDPIEKPIDKPVEKPPVDKPVEKPVDKPIDKPVEKPVDPAPKLAVYDKLGKEPGVIQIVDDFFAAVVANPDVKEKHKKHFQEGDVLALKNQLIDLLGEGTGGPQKYTGKSLKEALKGEEITSKDFDAVTGDFAKALDKSNVDKETKDAILKVIEGMRKDVVQKEE